MVESLSDDPQWYRDAVIYQLHVKTFMDSNDDGVGDFAGLTSRLDYLQDLGVTAIWMLPYMPSPLRDDGYDIADYTSVNADYGTMRQFRRFVEEAHERGLRVINELVINHTSDQHPWFQRAVKAPKGHPHRDWYVWNDTPDRYEDVRIIFQDFEPSNWTWHAEAGQYYWHRFFHHQPDLNFDNPDVRQAVKDVLDFWAETGVDGMRLDAIPYLFERDGTNGENLPETHAFLKELRAHLDRWPGRMFLAEANQWPEDAAAYFGDGDECQMNFHFPLMPRLYMAVAMEDRFPIIDILDQTPDIPEGTQWAVFLRNHDELTLEMVTDEERDYMIRAYAADPRMRVNLGIRRRLAPLLGNDRRLIELMNCLLFSMPGTPVIYYGDEIGMGDNIYLGDRNGVRTPMQWSPDRNAGFSKANPQKLYLPVITDPEYHYEAVNVEAQQNNPKSHLWWMKRIIAQRKRTQVFGRGTIEFLQPDNPKVLAFYRAHGDERVLVVCNLSRHAQVCDLDLADHAGLHLVEVFGRTLFPPIDERPYRLTLGPYQWYWFDVTRARERLSLSQLHAVETTPTTEPELPVVTVSGDWTALLQGRGRERLAAVLPDVLRRQRWFGGKGRDIRAATVRDVLTLGPKSKPGMHLLVVRVDYVQGDPDDYVVPVAFAAGEEAGRLDVTSPRAILATVKGLGKGVSGVLYDALHDADAATALLDAIGREKSFETAGGEVVGSRLDGFGKLKEIADLRPSTLGAEQSNTSVLYGDRYLLKLLRRLEPGINPDVEVGRYLSESAGIAHVPELVGTLEYRPAKAREAMTVAMVQAYVPNEGDAWLLTLDDLGRFIERVLSGGIDVDRSAHGAGSHPLDLARRQLPEAVVDAIGAYLPLAELLGQRTAEVHAALAAGTDKAFTPEPFGDLTRRSLYQSLRNAVRRGLSDAKKASRALPTEQRAQIQALAARESEILDRLQALSTSGFESLRTRTHGDYHLGQVLWTGRDFTIIDFEGEPARPIGERRLKRSPLRDVAGMLRSFHYAAQSTYRDELRAGSISEEDDAAVTLRAWLDYWARWVSASFLRGYLTAQDEQPWVPKDLRSQKLLLDGFLLEKAIYELNYELNNRPDWVAIPLDGLHAVLGD